MLEVHPSFFDALILFDLKSRYPRHHLSAAPLLPGCEEESLHLHAGNGPGAGDRPHDFLQVCRSKALKLGTRVH